MASQKGILCLLLAGLVTTAISGRFTVSDAIKGTSQTPQEDLVRVMHAPLFYVG